MSRNEQESLKAKQQREYEAGLKRIDPITGLSEATDCCQAQTPAPTAVPARESLLNWINAIEQDLVRQLVRLAQAKEVIYGADEFTLRTVKQLVELDFQRRF